MIMRKLIVCSVFLLTSLVMFAQTPVSVGKSQFNAGVGFSTWGVPVYAGFDVCVYPDVTVGGEISYRSYKDNWEHNWYNHNLWGITGNGNYHFGNILELQKKFDLYAGLNIGFVIWTSSSEYHGDHSSGLGLGIQVGGRYYFNNRIGVNLEFGGGIAFNGGKIGISIPF